MTEKERAPEGAQESSSSIFRRKPARWQSRIAGGLVSVDSLLATGNRAARRQAYRELMRKVRS